MCCALSRKSPDSALRQQCAQACFPDLTKLRRAAQRIEKHGPFALTMDGPLQMGDFERPEVSPRVHR